MKSKKTKKITKQFFSKKILLILALLGVSSLAVFFKVSSMKDNARAQVSNPSGTPMPNNDLNGWRLNFNDDFNTPVAIGQFPGSVYGAKWDAYPDGWKDTSKNGTYFPSKVLSVTDNGLLDMYIHTENGIHMVSAPLPNKGAGQLYGRYSVAFRSDSLAGYKTAWLLWPDSEVWPRDGEIDFPEGDLNSTIDAFMHRQGATSGGDQDAFSTSATFTSWHIATTEWSPNKLTFILDGNIIGSVTNRVPNTPMHWVLQTESTLNGTVPSDNTSGHVQIDWVAMWKYDPTAQEPTSTPAASVTPTPSASPTITQAPTPTIIPPTPTQTTILPAPTNIRPYGTIAPGNINIVWDSVPGATSYDLRIDDIFNGWNTTCRRINWGDVCKNIKTNKYVFNFIRGHTYKIWVSAKNATQTSPSSTPVTVTVANSSAR